MDDNFNNIEDEVVSSESTETNRTNNTLQKTANVIKNNKNTISREKNDILLGKGLTNNQSNVNKETINRLNNARNKNNNLVFNNSLNNEKEIQTNSQEKINEGLNTKKEQIKNKVAGKAIQVATHGAISAKNAEKIAVKAQQLITKKNKQKAYIAIGVAIGFILLIIILSGIFMNDDDKSNTISKTNRYNTGNMSEEELIDYLSYISICPSINDLTVMAEKYGVEMFEGVSFSVVRELAEIEEAGIVKSCTNALDYYESLKEEYDENKKACYRNRDKNNDTLPNYWKHTDPEAIFSKNPKAIAYFINHKDDYDCQIVLPTNLIFETMSYNLTDQELFVEDYLKKDNYVEYYIDHRKLSNALSEFVHETCYKWMYYNTKTKAWQYSDCDTCINKKKVEHDGYYFQVNFSKYVCFLKYGDTCNHPNYFEQPREKFPDLNYLAHECGSPSNDKITEETTETTDNGSCWQCGTDDYRWAISAPSPYCGPAPLTKSNCNADSKEGTCWKCDDGNNITYHFTENKPSMNCTSSKTTKAFCQGSYGKDNNNMKLVDYALNFVGNPYVYGGTSLTNGIDCSGFTQAIFKQFGVSLPHSSSAQRSYGTEVSSISDAQPGDLLCFNGHVGIYMGDGKMVHAAGVASGIKISNVGSRNILTIRRLIS